MSEGYVVWKRNDGFISASTGSTVPRTWTGRNGTVNSFEELLVTDNWPDARDRIEYEHAFAENEKRDGKL